SLDKHVLKVNDERVALYDVGGAKSQRRKWIHLPFAESPAIEILYFVSLACYDEILEEERGKNCLQDSLELFEELNEFIDKLSNPIAVKLVYTREEEFRNQLEERKIPLYVSGCYTDDPKTFNSALAFNWISQEFQKRCTRYLSTITVNL